MNVWFIFRYLFVVEYGVNMVIECVDLVGENWKIIIILVLKVFDIVVDIEEERIYWIDIGRNVLEMVKYDGIDRWLVWCFINIYIMMSGFILYKVWKFLFLGKKFKLKFIKKYMYGKF